MASTPSASVTSTPIPTPGPTVDCATRPPSSHLSRNSNWPTGLPPWPPACAVPTDPPSSIPTPDGSPVGAAATGNCTTTPTSASTESLPPLASSKKIAHNELSKASNGSAARSAPSPPGWVLPVNLIPHAYEDHYWPQHVPGSQPTYEMFTDGAITSNLIEYYLRALSIYGFKNEARRLADEFDQGYAAGIFSGGCRQRKRNALMGRYRHRLRRHPHLQPRPHIRHRRRKRSHRTPRPRMVAPAALTRMSRHRANATSCNSKSDARQGLPAEQWVQEHRLARMSF